MHIQTPCTTDSWPIDHVGVLAWRQKQVIKLRDDPKLAYGAFEYYRTRPVEFINHWCDTYNPRNIPLGKPTRVPLILFKRQQELVECLLACISNEVSALIEKSRDMGATWVCCAFSVWLWLFWPGAAIGWGSSKKPLVDILGNPNSIFEKMRITIRCLPEFFLPKGFSFDGHMHEMRIVNPDTGSTIFGETGDKIGRGGRSLIFFKDESAHYEHPELIEAALLENTNVQIDISSVNGIGNVFHRRREAGADWSGKVVPARTQVFVMDWSEHPAKDQSWYDAKKLKLESEGLQHVFAQEVDRNYAAAVEGTLIEMEWVHAAIDAHITLGLSETGLWSSALDVADGGSDTNAQSQRQGIILRQLDEWGARDTAVTARTAVSNVMKRGAIEVQYDCIGVGSGVKGEINNLEDENRLPRGIRFIPWNAGGEVLNPKKHVIDGDRDSPTNEDFHTNLKSQGWWELRNRFYRTWRAVTQDAHYDPDTLISIDSRINSLRKLEKELCQVTAGKGARLKMVINKTPDGTKSPNLADAIMMDYWPIASGYNLEKFMVG